MHFETGLKNLLKTIWLSRNHVTQLVMTNLPPTQQIHMPVSDPKTYLEGDLNNYIKDSKGKVTNTDED